MLKLLDEKLTPPGGWRFIDPETGYDFPGLKERYASLDALVEHVDRFRAQNGLDPLPDTRSIVIHYMCTQANVAHRCTEVPTPRTISQYIAGFRAALKMITRHKSRAYVLPFVAEKRAAICVRCPFNKVNNEHHALGKYADKTVRAIVGDRTTSKDGQLFSCSICTCPLRSKVHVAQDIVESSLSPGERARLPQGLPGLDGQPIYCWQVRPVEES